jgi:hypothetical protein
MLAVKKLCRDRSGAKARLEEAERVMRDRACAGGGWNYGNKEVYGQSLLPHVPPTAAGVLAFQDRPDDGLLTDAVRVLRQQAPREGSAAALAVAWLALSAVQSPTADVAEQLGRRIDAAEAVGNLAVLAMLLYVLERIERRERPLPFILTT